MSVDSYGVELLVLHMPYPSLSLDVDADMQIRVGGPDRRTHHLVLELGNHASGLFRHTVPVGKKFSNCVEPDDGAHA
jgi:hypothetical protein